MAAVKLTKNELKKQKDALKRYSRYLPTLMLKKQQLQLVIRQVEALLQEKTEARRGLFRDMQDWIGLFVDPFPLPDYLAVAQVRVEEGNVAGVEIPVFGSVEFERRDYDLFSVPAWVDEALVVMEKLAVLDIEKALLQEQVRLLAAELRVTSQRVNLFEKVKIPEALESIRKINIYLGDQQTAAVVRGKIAKSNLLRRIAS